MKNSIIKKALALVCALVMVFTLCACSSNGSDNGSGDSAKVYKVGICNYVDDASLNQTNKETDHSLVGLFFIGFGGDAVIDILKHLPFAAVGVEAQQGGYKP